MSTPHISASPGDFAETVLMPGDPLRARYIAEHFLDDARLVTSVRNMLGYTGFYQGRQVSVMGSGMGIPSMSIYAHELYANYGVKNIIRVGSCGSVRPDVAIRDVVIAQGACTDSGVNRARLHGYDFSAIASWNLLEPAVRAARELSAAVHVGNVFSADLFYSPDQEIFTTLGRYGVLAVEMEAAGLYGVAAENNANALAVCTVSDHILNNEQTSADERETTFNDMVMIALKVAAEQ